MADWHLRDLRNALEQRGWRLLSEEDGDGTRISGTWLLARESELRIDFDGIDVLDALPMEKSYACSVRGGGESLYFRRFGADADAHSRWKLDLARFVASLDSPPGRAGRLKP
jgi:hypothetical protein